MTKRYYLNDASTAYTKTKEFNLADSLYEENIEAKKKIKVLENKIKKLINAPDNAIVIFNSGASESIATCFHWISVLQPYGVVVGSSYDHSSVKENATVYKTDYEQIDLNKIEKIELNDRTSAIFMTHVNGTTGEIMNINKISENIKSYTFLRYDQYNADNFYGINRKILQYNPMMFLDATQSITKVDINMSAWNLNAVFWSDHKIGGQMARGVLVIAPSYEYPFIPLIAGAQNHNMRGGSISAKLVLQDEDIYNHQDDVSKRKNQWLAAYKYLIDNGLKVYKPKGPHLYSTLLIDVGEKCPYSLLNELAENYIYMSPKSACSVERKLNSNGEVGPSEWKELNDAAELGEMFDESSHNSLIVPKTKGGGQKNDFENVLRISFTEGDQLDQNVLSKIVSIIKD